MNRLTMFLSLIILFIGGIATAQNQTSFEDDALIVNLATGFYGANLRVADLNLPESFSAQIDSVNTDRYNLIIEVTHDPTGWKLSQWFINNEEVLNLKEYKIQWDVLQKCADQNINLARENTIRILLEELGLKSNHILVKSTMADSVRIKIYAELAPWVKPVSDNLERIIALEKTVEKLAEAPPAVINKTETYVIDSDWRVGIGCRSTLLGKNFINVPAISITMSQQSHRLGVTGGYLPGDEVDKKFLAMSFARFPGDHNLGWIARVGYASKSTELGYVERGIDVTLGGIYQNNNFDFDLSVGIEYFDNQYQSSSFEPTINLGVIYNIALF